MTDRPFTVPVHTKEMLGYEVGVGFINLVTMGIYIYIYAQVFNKYQVLITCHQGGLLAFKKPFQSPLLGGFEHPGNWGCIFKNQGYEIWVSFFIQPNLVARSTQNSEFKS